MYETAKTVLESRNCNKKFEVFWAIQIHCGLLS